MVFHDSSLDRLTSQSGPVASRTAAEAVDTLLAQRAQAQADDRARRDQADLDEIGRPRME